MSALGSPSPLFLASAAAADTAANITKSVRFVSGDSAYLNRTPSSAGNRKTWTASFWVKICKSAGYIYLMNCENTNRFYLLYQSGYITLFNTSGVKLSPDRVYRDNSAWYHMVIAFDTTQSTSTDRLKWYINGEEISDYRTNNTTYPSQNDQTEWNTATAHEIGSRNGGSFGGIDYYLTDFYFIDGSQKEATDFGAFDDNGVWQASSFSGSFGTNGFHLFDFANESGIGDDSSGNNNDFTANNLSSASGTIASPTRFVWETADSGWSLSDSNYTATNTTSGYRQVYSEALSGSTTYHFVLSEKPGDNNGGWFFSSNTSVSNTHPDELGSNTLGLRTGESGIGTSGTFSNANGVSGGQNAITGFSDITTSSGSFHHSEWVVNMTARKVWVRSFGSSSWIKGGDPTNSSSTPSFSLPTGAIYFGYVAYSSNETQVKLVTSVASVALGNDISFDVPVNGDQSDTGAGGEVSGNYATLNENILGTYKNNFTLSEGNLKTVHTQYATLPSTLAMSSGKWYCEGILDGVASASNQVWAGLLRTSAEKTAYEYFQGNAPTKGVHYWGDNTGLNRTQSYGTAYNTVGTVIGIAFDADAGSCTWYVNGSSQGASTYNIVQGEEYFFSFGAYTNGAWIVNFGARPFQYSAPSGYKALNTASISAATIADGSTGFDATLYTGNGSTQSISVANHSPDFVWVKSRNDSTSHRLFDTVRGDYKFLDASSRNNEATNTNQIAITSSGFDTGSSVNTNDNNDTYVAWTWDGGTSTVSNTNGSITSSVRASTTNGFSIVKYTGTGANATVGHGLNAAPDCIIFKDINRNDEPWFVYHSSLGNQANLFLNTTASKTTGQSDFMNNTDPTSSVFSLGNATGKQNRSGSNFLALCWSAVEGFSKFGEFMGNGNSDGPFIYLGFKPALIWVKGHDFTSNWFIHDYKRPGHNVNTGPLRIAAEVELSVTTYDMDFLSNGFKMRTSSGDSNQNNKNFAYFAWAENPFQANGGLAR